jgi:hypothetical protein
MFSELHTYPTYPLSTLRGLPHDRARARLEAAVAREAFLVRLFHPLPHAGLSRRTKITLIMALRWSLECRACSRQRGTSLHRRMLGLAPFLR